MSTNTPEAPSGAAKPFDINMDVPATLPGEGGGFVSATAVRKPSEVKRSTFSIRMPMLLSRGQIVKRLLTILLPRHQDLAILPHTSSTHDKITDQELIPTDDIGIGHYIFDEKITLRNRGSRNEFKMLECKMQIESPISLYHIKGAPKVMDLLKKHDIYITGKSYCPAVSTKEIGILMNLDARRSAKNRIIEMFQTDVGTATDREVFIDLIPHRALVRLNNKVVFGQFLKVMVDVKYASVAAEVVRDGLKSESFGVGLKNVRLMPVYPIPNLFSSETFAKMIIAHNDSMYGVAEIQVDHVWDIDSGARLPDTIKERFNLAVGPSHVDDVYTLRDTMMPIFWGQFDNEPIVRDIYIQRGHLMIVCEKAKIEEVTKLVDMMLAFFKENYDVYHESLVRSEDKFAEWVGCSTPKNHHRHPARSGTLIFGEGGLLKATVNSFLDQNLNSLPAGLIPTPGDVARKPDLTRPPPASIPSRGRVRPQVDPTEFTATAVSAWASANTWSTVVKRGNRKRGSPQNQNQRKQKAPTREVIEIDNATQSTVSLSSGTQSALDAMRKSVQVLEQDKKKYDDKMMQLDKNMEEVCNSIASISNEQKHTREELVSIKQQMVANNAQLGTKMEEMNTMLLAVFNHLDGQIPQNNANVNNNSVSQSQLSASGAQKTSSLQAAASDAGASSAPSDDVNEVLCDVDDIDHNNTERRKFLKQAHPKVFNLQGQNTDQQDSQVTPGITVNRANSPQLLHTAIASRNGSTANLSPTVEEQSAMAD